MNDGLIPRRYAKALFLVAQERKAATDVYDLMKTLAASFADNHELQGVLSNPYIADADKCSLLTTAAGASKANAVFSDFLKLLSENRRLDMARDIAIAYVKLYRDAENIHEVKIESAAPLSSDLTDRLRRLIAEHLQGGTMEFTQTVNPDLIGGFTVSVGNERIDASIKNELKQLRMNLITK